MKKTVLILLLLCSTVYAEPNLMATGYDYVKMENKDKIELVSTLYKVFKRDNENAERTAMAIDFLYYSYSNEIKDSKDRDKAMDAVFNKPVMAIVAELLTMPEPNPYPEDLMKKYGLTLKK